MKRSARYRDRVAERLRALLEARGTSVHAVEKQLDHGRGFIGDALRAQKKLSVETILEVLDVLDVPPEEFFEQPMPDRGEPAPTKQLKAVASLSPPLGDHSPVVQAVLLLLAEKGHLSPAALRKVQRELASVKLSDRPQR